MLPCSAVRTHGVTEVSAPTNGVTEVTASRPRSGGEVTQANVKLIARLEAAALKRRGRVDRIVDAVSGFCGSTTFLWAHALWFSLWIASNSLPGLPHIDAFPFPFLTFVVSLEAILLSTFILISQNRQGLIQERRNQLDLQINLLAEQENTKTLQLLIRIAQKLGVEDCDEGAVSALEEEASPERLVRQIEESMGHLEKLGTPA